MMDQRDMRECVIAEGPGYMCRYYIRSAHVPGLAWSRPAKGDAGWVRHHNGGGIGVSTAGFAYIEDAIKYAQAAGLIVVDREVRA